MTKWKLKERLARDWSDPHFVNMYDGYDCDPEEAYLAGFEKAREMAAKKVVDNRHELTWAEEFENLGEEEVT